MGIYTELPNGLDEVDVIIAGGGTTACVVASRLADADPQLSILLVEAGQDNQTPTIQYPACFLSHLAPNSTTTQYYLTNKSAQVADRTLFLPTGAVLGGGSSTNMMMYSRAQRSDWDLWNMAGWSADDMLPYLRKLETYHGSDPKGVHGRDGPIHISRGPYDASRIPGEFVAAAAEMGWAETEDLSDLDSIDAVWRAKRFISPDGKRQDAASCYLHPRLRDGAHRNLHVLLETQVLRVLLDDAMRAVGVEVRGNPRFQPGGAPPSTIRARRLVVASCGAIGTPSLLERSGIGSPDVLKKAGVPVAVELGAVGAGYEDHHLLGYPYLNSLGLEDTLDGLVFGRLGSHEDLMRSNHDMMGWNGQEMQAKIRPSRAEVAGLGPDFQEAWDREYEEHPDKPLAVLNVNGGFPGDPSLTNGDPCLAVTVFTVYPFSRGHIHISGPTIDDPVDFESGFFTDAGQLDVKKHMWAYKKQREAMRRMPSYRGEMAAFHPPFAAGSPASCVDLRNAPSLSSSSSYRSGSDSTKDDIEYSADDDAVLERWLRENVSTTWHSLGTCKMGDVVDAAGLGVHGTRGLKVADLSVAPRNLAANTNNTALAIGEKAADLFIGELGLLPPTSSA